MAQQPSLSREAYGAATVGKTAPFLSSANAFSLQWTSFAFKLIFVGRKHAVDASRQFDLFAMRERVRILLG